MPYHEKLAHRIREHLSNVKDIHIEEKKMFSGLAFVVSGKMCINVSGENLMCHFDPALYPEVSRKKGFQPMIMKGKELKGYCYVSPDSIKNEKDVEYFIKLSLDFNKAAKSSKKRKT